jgi:hypothetical protein
MRITTFDAEGIMVALDNFRGIGRTHICAVVSEKLAYNPEGFVITKQCKQGTTVLMISTGMLVSMTELKIVHFTTCYVYDDWYAVFIQSSNIFEIDTGKADVPRTTA